MKQTEILIKSTLDDSMQPSLFYKAETDEKRPLLVGLHTWSYVVQKWLRLHMFM